MKQSVKNIGLLAKKKVVFIKFYLHKGYFNDPIVRWDKVALDDKRKLIMCDEEQDIQVYIPEVNFDTITRRLINKHTGL